MAHHRDTGSESDLGRVVMVVPTYNEALNLELIINRLRKAQPEVDILVVDDSSPDGTGALADRIAASDAQVSVLHRPSKEGLGAAYRHGFRVALEGGYDVVGEMDADGSHQPEELYRLLDALRDADLVIGSRWIPGGGIVNWPLRRELLSRGGNFYTRTLLGIPVRDATSGYRLFRRTTLERINLEAIVSLGYVFQAELAYLTVREGLRVTEVPIEFLERLRGDSKMSAHVATESLKRITLWGVSERSRRVRAAASRGLRREGRRRGPRNSPPAPGR